MMISLQPFQIVSQIKTSISLQHVQLSLHWVIDQIQYYQYPLRFNLTLQLWTLQLHV